MLKKYPNLSLFLLAAAVLVLCVVQGRRVEHLRESDTFYRWILAAGNQARVFGKLAVPAPDEPETELMDDVLFEQVADAMEPQLPDLPVTGTDYDAKGQLHRKLVRGVNHASEESGKALDNAFGEGEENLHLDQQIWALAQSPALVTERDNFFTYLRQKKLSSAGTQLNASLIYTNPDASINLANLFFGFRKLAANFVWLQVDRYWHAGEIHRMLPAMNMCVILDPNFVDAYLIGAWHLAYNLTAKMQPTPPSLRRWDPKHEVWLGDKERYYYMAIDFLKDGIRSNPRNYKLYFDLGFAIYELKMQDHANAVAYLSEAVRYISREDRWVPRQLYICMQRNGQYEDALRGWERYLKLFPDYVLETRFLDINRGMIAEQEAEAAKARAASTTSEEEAQKARKEAEQYFTEARAIWSRLIATGGEHGDAFAQGRLLRMRAIEYAEQGRYDEAIAVLDHGRRESNDLWDEASDLIIKYKEEAGIRLSLSERQAVLRKQEEEKFKQRTPPAE